MARCAHTYGDYSQCKRIVGAEQDYCYSHDPGRSEERKRNAARGGKAKASGEMRALKTRLQALADMVEEGRMDRADAAVIGQLLGNYIRAVGMELKVKEVTELEGRFEELERALGQRGGNRWGA